MKRLYRDKSNEMIAGVCSGIAEYLDVDPTIIRLIFVLFAFVGGGGLWIYLVLWIIMPEKPGNEKTMVTVEEKPAEKETAKAVDAPAEKKTAAKTSKAKPKTASTGKTSTTAKKTAPKAKKPAAKKTTSKPKPSEKPDTETK